MAFNNVEHIIDNLNNYMFTPKNLSVAQRNRIPQFRTSVVSKREKSSNSSLFVPTQEDTLFWIFFILTKGMAEYNLLGKYTFQYEHSLKIEYITRIKENKLLWKRYKLQKIVDCENELLNDKKISLKTFFVLCILENINILYIYKRCFYPLLPDDDIEYISMHDFQTKLSDENSPANEVVTENKPIYEQYPYIPHVVHRLSENEFAYDFQAQREIIYNYMRNRHKMESFEKPIKTISNYKLNELQETCKKYFIPIETNHTSTKKKMKTKPDLYNAIIDYLCC